MRPELKQLFSLDIEDLEHHQPENAGFKIPIRIIVGPVGTGAEESFDFDVCSSTALEREVADGMPHLLRHVVVMETFDYDRLYSFVCAFLNDCSGQTWDEVAVKISRLGKWEFEDYSA